MVVEAIGNGETQLMDQQYLLSLEQRIVSRATEEWPGVHTSPTQIMTAGPVRPGGATDTLIRFTAHIAVEELNKF